MEGGVTFRVDQHAKPWFEPGGMAKPGFAQRDWILLADLENESGDSVFDRSLKAALAVAIAQSR